MPLVLSILLAGVSVLLILIVLLQRGRGGGLAGAFGGLGGQSAFGTKAGDVFTRITIGIAVVWVALSGLTGLAMYDASEGRYKQKGTGEVEAVNGDPDIQQADPKAKDNESNPFPFPSLDFPKPDDPKPDDPKPDEDKSDEDKSDSDKTDGDEKPDEGS